MDNFMKKSAVFLAKFFAIFLALHTLLYFVDISFLQHSIAGFVASLLGLSQSGSLIDVEGNLFEVTKNCTGLVSAFILAAIVFSLKKPGLKQKTISFIAGFVTLLLANLIRVYGVLVVGLFFGLHAAELTHTISWFVMSFLIILLWFYLTKKVSKIQDFSDLI